MIDTIQVIGMSYPLKYAKEFNKAIVKVTRKNNKLLFYEASNLVVPTKVILLENLKSIEIDNFDDSEYLTQFYYHNDTNADRLMWRYSALNHNWEKETIKLINKTIQLI